jgi:hypothetical protein
MNVFRMAFRTGVLIVAPEAQRFAKLLRLIDVHPEKSIRMRHFDLVALIAVLFPVALIARFLDGASFSPVQVNPTVRVR